MDEVTLKKILAEMEIPVTVEIPNAIVISKDLVRKGLVSIGAYVVAKKILYIYVKAYIAKERGREK